MSALVVYASQYGNTQKIAEAIGEALQPDARVVTVADAKIETIARVDLLIAGSPTQAGRPLGSLQSFLSSLPEGSLTGVRVAAFDSRFDVRDQKFMLRMLMRTIKYAAGKIAGILTSKGGRLIAPPEGFFVTGKEGPLKDGEIDRAQQWAKSLMNHE